MKTLPVRARSFAAAGQCFARRWWLRLEAVPISGATASTPLPTDAALHGPERVCLSSREKSLLAADGRGDKDTTAARARASSSCGAARGYHGPAGREPR